MFFLYSVVAGLLAIDDNKIKHLDRQSTIMKHCDKYNLKIDENMYPIPVDNNVYRSIEQHIDFSVSVYGFQYDDKDEKYTRYQIYQTSGKKEKHINLLYIENENNGHYTLIKNLVLLFQTLQNIMVKPIFVISV